MAGRNAFRQAFDNANPCLLEPVMHVDVRVPEEFTGDIISDMKGNMVFLAPLLAGIVVGLASMITNILGQLRLMTELGEGDVGLAGLGDLGNITNLFNVTTMIPPYFMQIAIGVYIIQIIFILTRTLVTIDAGEDRLKQTYEISRNLMRGGILYLIVALISVVALSLLGSVAVGGLAG